MPEFRPCAGRNEDEAAKKISPPQTEGNRAESPVPKGNPQGAEAKKEGFEGNDSDNHAKVSARR